MAHPSPKIPRWVLIAFATATLNASSLALFHFPRFPATLIGVGHAHPSQRVVIFNENLPAMPVVRMMGDTSLATVNRHFNLDDAVMQGIIDG